MTPKLLGLSGVRGICPRLCLLLVVSLLSTSSVPHTLSETISVIPLTFVVSTSSDWTTLSFYNLTLLNYSYHLTSGQNAPQLSYSVSPSVMYIGKKQYDETNVTLQIEGLVQPTGGQAMLLVEKGAIGDTILRIYFKGKELAIFPSRGSVPGHEDTNPRAFELNSALGMLKADMTEIDLERHLRVPMVLAFYYPWYGNPRGKSGQLYHWSDVTYQGIGSSTYYPLFGPYDSQDEGLIGAHMELAKASGIDGFICSWWGIDTFEDRSFKQILKVANPKGFNVTIYYETVREIGPDQMVNELAYVVRSYSNEPSFLKIDGRPVIFLYAISAYHRDAAFWQDIISRVKGSTGVDPLYIADTFDMAYASAFDGFHTYNPIGIKVGDLNNTYSDQAKAARIAGKIWAATVCPGYDDRKIRSPGTYVSRQDGAYYNLTWGSAIGSDPDIVLICTWNEWHEGTNIEPSREFEFKYLQLTNYWAAILKSATLSGSSQARPVLNLNFTSHEGGERLRVYDPGNGDAFAINLFVTSEGIGNYTFSNAIYLPINSSTIALFIPLIVTNQIQDISFNGADGMALNAYGYYYSSGGKRFTGTSYNVQYFLSIDSPYGRTTGSGWYSKGSIAYAGLASNLVNVTTGVRHLFSGWSGDAGGKNYLQSTSIVMDGPRHVIANWITQYTLIIESQYGSPTGEGWQMAGSYATISIDSPVSEWGGLISHNFQGWQGAGITASNLPTTTVLMDGPKSVNAIWTTDYTPLAALLAVAISGMTIAAIYGIRRRK
jgi:glycoprotein endo-alpha-1,2-mannosidase